MADFPIYPEVNIRVVPAVTAIALEANLGRRGVSRPWLLLQSTVNGKRATCAMPVPDADAFTPDEWKDRIEPGAFKRALES